ncbi:MAG TPA: hypothetical protein DIT64_12995, partial [Verrucomicrobiales bacterium]|nr:hypothetical protein [Verrucomicrobiales bacterium]
MEPPSDPEDAWWDEDSDGDGMTNREELAFFSDPYSIDVDGDGLTDLDERDISSTDPWAWDSDSNGFSDYDDYYYSLDPTLNRVNYQQLIADDIPFLSFSDADGDGIQNPWDDDPLNFDKDGDGIVNWEDPYPDDSDNGEGTGYWYNGARYPGEWVDTDGDGIPDPADPYPEGGFWYQGVEYDPVFATDSDGDGVPDAWDSFPNGSVWWYGAEYSPETPDPGFISQEEWDTMTANGHTYDHHLG